MKREDLQPAATVRGILPDAAVSVVSVEWHGSDALTLVYRGRNGRVADEILYRDDEPPLELRRRRRAVPPRRRGAPDSAGASLTAEVVLMHLRTWCQPLASPGC